MSRSIFGVTVSPFTAWVLANPTRFAAPCAALPRGWNVFARNHTGDGIVRKGDLLAVHAGAWKVDPREVSRAATALREAMDTSVPWHTEPYAALAGRVVAVVPLVGTTTRPRLVAPGDVWVRAAVRDALGARPQDAAWSWLLGDAMPLPEPVECAGSSGVWSLPRHVSEAVMSQVRALEAARARAVGA